MKPRVRWIGFGWACEGEGRVGLGIDWAQAYRNWVLSHMLPKVQR